MSKDTERRRGPAAASAAAIPVIEHHRKSGTWLTHLQLRLGMGAYLWALRLARSIGPSRRPSPPAGHDILLTGTFFSDNWVRSHLLPLAASDRCARLRMVATSRVPEIPKVEGLYPPHWLVRTAGAVPARLLYFIWVGVRTRPDVVGGFHLLVNGLVSALLARVTGARSMYFCVGGPVELLDGGVWGENRIFARLGDPDAVVERQLIEAASACDIIITMGTRAVTFFRERGLTNRIHVVSGGIDPSRFYSADAPGPYDVVIACRLVPIKRVDLFLRTVRLLANDLPRVKALIVGDGPLRADLEALAGELELREHVEFVGQQPDVERWLRMSKVFVLTSDSEGLSLSLMEAMMSGLPAVVSDVGDLGDIVAEGVNGHLVSGRTPEAFAAALLPLLQHPETLNLYSEAASRAGARHAPEAVTARWGAILDEEGAAG